MKTFKRIDEEKIMLFSFTDFLIEQQKLHDRRDMEQFLKSSGYSPTKGGSCSKHEKWVHFEKKHAVIVPRSKTFAPGTIQSIRKTVLSKINE